MKYDFQYQSGARSFDADFGRVINATDGGFERGYTQGYTEGETAGTAKVEASNAIILSDCNAVLPDKGVEVADSLEQVPQRIGEIKPEPLWFPHVASGYGMFHSEEFPPNTELILNIPNLYRTVVEMFQGTKNVVSVKLITSTSAKDKGSLGCQGDGMFRYNYHIRKVDLSEFKSNFFSGYMMFNACNALEEIIGELWEEGSSNHWNNAFSSCVSLKEIRFKNATVTKYISFAQSAYLSPESIQSIIDGLADLTGQAAQTLTLHGTVGAKLTEAQKETVAAKNWTLVY